jgi:hypothetical protein
MLIKHTKYKREGEEGIVGWGGGEAGTQKPF